MPARIKSVQPVTLEDLAAKIPPIFDQAQVSNANHQKNIVALHKIHIEAAQHVETINRGKNIKLTGERKLEDVFLQMISLVLPLKKGVLQADRIVKFVGGYSKLMNEKSLELKQEESQDEEQSENTVPTRFIARLLRFFLKGFVSKDKTVRYRVLQFVAELVSHTGEIDEEIYTNLRKSLLDRLHDKEPSIRVQAVIAISKLSGSEDPAELQEGEPTVVEALVEVLGHDPSAEVRRAALLNLPVNPITIASILDRTRDEDNVLRKLVYTVVLERHIDPPEGIPGVGCTHPRALRIAQRELIVRNGLGDREASVRTAAASLLARWVEVMARAEPQDSVKPENDLGDETSEGKEKQKDKAGELQAQMAAFIQMFDLAESKIAEEALVSVFTECVDIFDNLEFGDSYWDDLTPERAFLARVFVEHCITTKDDTRLESALPVVTALAFRIQSAYNEFLEDIRMEDEETLLGSLTDEEKGRREEARAEREFVIAEMLKLAVNLDYADEIGRRKMFQLIRDMIAQEALPESLVARCLDIMRELSAGERDLIRVVVEVVHELRDSKDEEDELPKDGDADTSFAEETPITARPARAAAKTRAEMSPEEKLRADEMDLRCLSLCIGMLERVNGTFEENGTLEGILKELIVPAVKRKELALREKGLVCLGLCCLIARRMAVSSFQLFMSQVQAAPEVLKLRVLQIVFDILMVQGGDFLGKNDDQSEKIIKSLLNELSTAESEKVQALLCMGIAKLVLAGMITEPVVLHSLAVAYLSPNTIDNQELRQCLSYFFPVYCYSSPVNQRRLKEVFLSIFDRLATMHRNLDEDQEMVSSAQVGGMLVDWTDPQKAVEIPGQHPDELIHFDLAQDIVKALYNRDMEKEDKRVLCQLLGKLYIPETVDNDKVWTLKLLMLNLSSRRPLRDTTANNAFTRFDATISKKFEKQLQDFNEDEFRKLEELKHLFEFLDDIIPLDDEDDDVDKKPVTRSRKRRSQSTTTNSADDDITSSSTRSDTSKPKAKKPRLSNDSIIDDDEPESKPSIDRSSLPPTRKLPKRSASTKKPVVIVVSSDDEEDQEATPVPKRKKITPRYRTSVGVKLDSEINEFLGGNSIEDSIFVEDSEDEEDEVSNILAS